MSESIDVLTPEEHARRVLPLEGGINFRDLGGYRTTDGRHVKWGKLFRSGSMVGLTEMDFAYLAGLGIRRVIDLRTPEERELEPNHWAMSAGIESWSRDYTSTFGVLRELLTSDLPTVEAALAAMASGYRRLPFEHAPSYRVLFESLAHGQVPMVFNCSAGKDRAGTAAALVLTALGVPHDAILRDYALTDRLLDVNRMRALRANPDASARARGHHPGTVLAKVPAEVIKVVMGTHPDCLASVFEEIDARHGDFATYLEAELGIGPAALSAIRDALLE